MLTVSAANGVLKNDSDSDSGETLTAVLVSGPTNAAAFALNADGSFSYTPDSNFNGTDTFTYKVRDSHGAASASVTATIGVTEVNDAPALNPIANPALLDEDAGPQTISLSGISAGPANESGQSLTVTVTSSNPLLIPNPVVTYTSPNATGSLSFTPLPNANGSAEITIVVKDNVGTANGGQNTSTSVTFTVTVTPINDPPTIVVGRGAQCASPNTPTGTITILVGDVESGASSLTLAGNSSNQALIPNGNMTFGGSGANRTATITALLNTGTAAITIIVMMVR